MIKKALYPKTERVKCSGLEVEITEKLDGSNLCFFKKDGVVHIAQRNNIFTYNELEEHKNSLYKGLYQWLIDNRDELHTIRNNSVVCGEWLGMGKLKYTDEQFDKRFYMFAKANIDEDLNLINIRYYHDLFIYPFETLEIPSCVGVVPVAFKLDYLPDKNDLDDLYETYWLYVKRDIEGFVVNYNNQINKYVRMKNGKLSEHVG